MPSDQKPAYLQIEDYLKLEASSPTRHEYVDGQMYAMSGASRRHNVIVGNFFALLHGALSGGPCRPYVEAVKVFVKQVKAFYYPDVMVACKEVGMEGDVVESPALIVEVLSPSTAAIDRREKLTNYRYLQSLKEYAIVHQRDEIVELHTKDDDGCWLTTLYRTGDTFTLQSLTRTPVTISVSALYRDTGLTDRQVQESAESYDFSDPLGVYRYSEQELAELEY